MHARMVLTALLMTSLSLAGCTTGSDGDLASYECQTKEAELFVTARADDSVPIYSLNDDQRQMRVVAMGFSEDGQTLEVPNPQIRLQECDTLVLTVTNLNPLPHTFHLHGWRGDWTQDGVPFISQLPIHQGESFTYTFADLKAGTYWYHCHVDAAHHIDLGMYGAFIVEEREPEYDYDFDLQEHVLMLDEWDNCHIHASIQNQERENANAVPGSSTDCNARKFQDFYVQNGFYGQARDPLCSMEGLPQEVYDQLRCQEHFSPPPGTDAKSYYPVTFPAYFPEYNSFTINGKAYPDTAPVFFEEGRTYRFRFINVGEEMHSMHIHGHGMKVIKRDLDYLPAPVEVDTLAIMPGERYDVLVEADNPGFWVFHDHVGLNVMNDHVAPGGMLTVIGYTGAFAQEIGYDPASVGRADDLQDIATAYLQEHGGEHGHARSSPLHDAEHLYVGTDGTRII